METRSDGLPLWDEPKLDLLPRGNSATLLGLSMAVNVEGAGR